jgi:hypothetical protein
MAKETVKPFPKVAAAEPCKKGERKRGVEDVQDYLRRFGYLQSGKYNAGEVDDETSKALGTYQELYGLPKTEDFDESTKSEMTKHRCAMPDLVDGVRAVTRCAWDKRRLTYAFNHDTRDIVGMSAFQAVRDAFRTWANVVPLTFVEVRPNNNPDIEIDWRDAKDPDNDMRGGTLAHADFPPGCGVVTDTLPLPLHFDDSEHVWSIGSVNNAFDVETTALHEIGHCLGLMHTTIRGAVMWPSIASNSTLRALHDDDISGIQSLYPSL